MLIGAFKITFSAVAQIFLLGAIGYILFKRKILKSESLDFLSRLVMDITLPLLIFCQLAQSFTFERYPKWWIFPLFSLLITLAGLFAGFVFVGLVKGMRQKLQFLSLAAFQNSGYLPLALIAALLPKERADEMFIYLFLFLLGFNLVIFSFGSYLLALYKKAKFKASAFFSPPVIAALAGLLVVRIGLADLLPQAMIRPLKAIGDCTLPLAMFVVGASLAAIDLKRIDKKEMLFLVLAKLIILPALGLWAIIKLELPELMGLLILIELAMPPATFLSVITRHYNHEDLLISQGIFVSHILSIVTIPVFLGLYFNLVMIK